MGVFFFLEGSVEGKIREKRREEKDTHNTQTPQLAERERGRIDQTTVVSSPKPLFFILFFSSNRILTFTYTLTLIQHIPFARASARLGSARAPTRASVCGVIGVAMPMPVWLNLTRKGARDDAV